MAKRRSPAKKTQPAAKKRPTRSAPVPSSQVSPFSLPDDHVERALLTGDHSGLLQDYFGEANYAELRDLAREASTRSMRGGQRVLILPGIMGSTLGWPRTGWLDDVLWFDPVDIAAGRLTDLRLNGGGSDIKALGVILYAYLKLKLNLKIGGYDADFHPFDWRRNLSDLGRELADRIRAEGRPVSLVAHSMGGLVARAALKTKLDPVVKVIQLGTPNYGSYCPVQVLRATYDTVKKIAAIDFKHTITQLCNEVFNTFIGLYQMLPAPGKSALDLFDAAKWPQSDPRPLAPLLKLARDTQSLMVTGDNRFYLIAGVNQNTVTGVSVDDGEFVFSMSQDGDGTVPLDFAKLDGIPANQIYYVEAGHGDLPNNAQVEQAVRELLASGRTGVLPNERPASSRAVSTVRESEVRGPDVKPQRGGVLPGTSDLREALRAVAAPPTPGAIPGMPAAAAGAAAGAPEGALAMQAFQGLVVGRRRQARLELRLANGSITDVDSRAYVLGTFSNVAPSGAARAIDEKLSGAITEFTERRMLSSSVGEIFAVPAGRNALRADMVLFAGLGPFDSFNSDVQQLVAENAIRMLARTKVEEFATVLIGGGTGQSTAAIMQNLLTGFFRGLRDSGSQSRFRSITLCETDKGRYAEIKQELYRLSATQLFNDIEVTLDEIEMPPVQRLGPPRGPDPIYLLFRTELGQGGRLFFRSSILSSGARAALITTTVEKSQAEWDALLGRLNAAVRGRPENLAALDSLGADFAKALIPEAVCSELLRMRDRHLVVVHDELSSQVPWELLRIQDWSPAAEAGLTHRYMADNLPLATWAAQRRSQPALKVLLISNPTRDLDGADEEAKRVRDVAAKFAAIQLTDLPREKATRAAVLHELRSGDYDVLHYAGHAHFVPNDRSQSGLFLADGSLHAPDLKGVSNLPTLVFFNACESGRMRAGKPKTPAPEPLERVKAAVSLAEGLLRSGVANFLGTYWPVGDDSAKEFASRFYQDLLGGASIGDALQNGRKVLRALPSRDWADYVFYGSQDFVLKEKPGGEPGVPG